MVDRESFFIELQDGRYATVKGSKDKAHIVRVDRFLEALLKWGGFHDFPRDHITQEMIDALNYNLQNSEEIYFH